MKSSIQQKRTVAIATTLLAALRLTAQEPISAPQTEARRASLAQGALKQDAEKIQADLAKLREEVRQFTPEHLELVDRAYSQVASLSTHEMDEAIKRLAEAAKTGDHRGQVQALAGAVKNQRQIETKLKSLATDLYGRPELVSLGQKLRDLLPRQIAQQRALARIAQLSPTPKEMLNHLREPYDIVCGNQDNISQDLKIAVKAIAQEAASSPIFARIETISAEQKLGANAARAAFLTRMGPFAEANTAQANVAQSLTLIVKVLDGEAPLAEQLRILNEQISKIEETQMQAVDSRDDRDRKRREAEATSQAAAMIAEIAPVNAGAAQELQNAEAAMERAAGAMQGPEKNEALTAQAQAEALSALNDARTALQIQLGSGSKDQTSPTQQALSQAEQHTSQAAAATRLAEANLGSAATASNASQQIQAAEQQLAQAEKSAAEANAPSAASHALAQARQQLSMARESASANALPQAQSTAQAARKALAKAGAAFANAESGAESGAGAPKSAVPGKGTQEQQQAQGGGAATDQGLLSGAGKAVDPPALVRAVSGLSPRDRDAVVQFQKQTPPPAFVSEVQQYYKNLAEGL